MTRDEILLMTYPVHSTITSTKLRIRGSKADKRMATNIPLQHSSSTWSLDHLSTELLVLIFEQSLIVVTGYRLSNISLRPPAVEKI